MDEQDRPGGGGGLPSFLARQPFALLGAIGLLSLARDLLEFREWIATWIDAFQGVTRPVWEFLLGWIARLAGQEIPDRAKDYLTVGAIVFGMTVRAKFAVREGTILDHAPVLPFFLLQCLLFWPLVFVTVAATSAAFFLDRLDDSVRLFARVFWESGVWVLIIIAVNYALLRETG